METKELVKSGVEALKDTGLVLGGMIVGNGLVKVVKQDNYLGNGLLFGGGIAGAMFIKNKTARALFIAGAAFGGLRLANLATNDVVKSTSGLAGMIPDSVKMKIREFLPNLSGEEALLLGRDNEFPNLDDKPEDMGFHPYEDVTNKHDMSGLGADASLLL